MTWVKIVVVAAVVIVVVAVVVAVAAVVLDGQTLAMSKRDNTGAC